MNTVMGHVVDFITYSSITVNAHGLSWIIEMKDNYSGYDITNNAGGSYESIDLPEALALVKNFKP